jgi:hypothetical protein
MRGLFQRMFHSEHPDQGSKRSNTTSNIAVVKKVIGSSDDRMQHVLERHRQSKRNLGLELEKLTSSLGD